jgi:hypothetical protein
MSQWEPRYDPGAHQRRLDDGVPPQGYGQPPPQQYQPGWQPPQPPPGAYRAPGRPPRKSRTGRTIAIIAACAVATFIIVAAVASGGKTPQASASSPPATGAPATGPAVTASQAPPAAQAVTYVVTGSSADVTYGPAGSDSAGTVPMRKSAAIPASPAAYYAISAQLQGGGSVTCELIIGGTVISRATATGGYNIADCEAVQDPVTGQWQDANSA